MKSLAATEVLLCRFFKVRLGQTKVENHNVNQFYTKTQYRSLSVVIPQEEGIWSRNLDRSHTCNFVAQLFRATRSSSATELQRIEQCSVRKKSCATVKRLSDTPCHTCNSVGEHELLDKVARQSCATCCVTSVLHISQTDRASEAALNCCTAVQKLHMKTLAISEWPWRALNVIRNGAILWALYHFLLTHTVPLSLRDF